MGVKRKHQNEIMRFPFSAIVLTKKKVQKEK
jgi:hypothetical protein